MATTKAAYRRLVLFFRKDEGLVTLEWVALAAAVILLSAGVVTVIHSSLNTAASSVGSNIVSAANSNS